VTRVAAVTKGLGPGGSERLLVEFARVAQAHGIELSVVSLLEQKQHLIPDFVNAGVPVRCIGVSRLLELRWVPQLLRALRASGAEIVHVHSPALAPVVRIAAHLRLLGVHRPRMVTTEHNRWPSYHRITRTANAITAFLDDATVAVSDEVRRSIRPATLARRAITVRHGIDLEQARSQRGMRHTLRAEWGVPDDGVVVVTVANYRPQKNYPVLLRACALATASMPSIRFVVVGQGPGAAEVESLHRQLGLGDRMLLLGYRPDAIAVMAAADIFTLSSDYEGLPVALMEALALGLAIVCTDVGGISETVDSFSGRLVPPGDPEALGGALVEVAANTELLARLRSGASRIGDSFDVNRNAEELSRIYRHVLNGR
jgi:glycosyltransferase involved in cell wall biosynthesis